MAAAKATPGDAMVGGRLAAIDDAERLAAVDAAVLESLVAWSVEEIARRHPAS
jgi:hypothetical protein